MRPESRSSASSPRRRSRTFLWAATALLALLALPSLAAAHLERPSYWPDPRPDKSISPPAGGKVPKARSLHSAMTGQGPGEVRVVCLGKKGAKSLDKALGSIKNAETKGFRLRPSQPNKKISAKEANKLRNINRALAERCRYHSVQKAVNDSGNNDRVVIMPGRYVEKASRNSPVNDPRCNPSMLQGDQRGTPTPSYRYQVKCPNDQNLIHVAGRAVKGSPMDPPRADRHGIPGQELGRCIRCNLQIEGSGAKPEDVILDAGVGYKKPLNPEARPGGDTPASKCLTAEDGKNPCFAKHVVLRVDRGDGFVGRNFLMRGAREHGFYTEETDGVLLAKVKFFWNADYGHLSFTTDHHLVQFCDGFGSGDAVVYPGAAPQTGLYRKESFYPERRYNSVIKKCDLHGSSMGYSGSMGNSVRVTENRFYGNANGLTTDTLSSPGHPGFPADGMRIDHNWFYANNLDVYRPNNPFEALVPQPVGTGFFWPGNNDGDFLDNWVFDNWRQGTMMISIPDAVAGEVEGAMDDPIHCLPDGGSTSCYNIYRGNHMGQVPPKFKPHPDLTRFGNKTTLTGNTPNRAPNGVDFWWDQEPSSIGNCWPDNTGPDGTRASLNSDPAHPPSANQNLPTFLPELCTKPPADPSSPGNHNPATSMGDPGGYSTKVPILLACFAQYESGNLDAPGCSWFNTPPKPGTAGSQALQRQERSAGERWGETQDGQQLREWVRAFSGTISLGPSH
jgi:hypothetical protein